jgi:hypothetical protein
MSISQILNSLPQEIGARFAIPNSLWTYEHELRKEIERRGWLAIETTPSQVTLRRDLYGLAMLE